MRKLLLSLIILSALIALPVGAQNETEIVSAAEGVVDSQSESSSSGDISEVDTLTQRIFEGDPERSYSLSTSEEHASRDQPVAYEDISGEEAINNLNILGSSSDPKSGVVELYNDVVAENSGKANNSEQAFSEELNQMVNAFDQSDGWDVSPGNQTSAPDHSEIMKIFEQSDLNYSSDGKNNFISIDGFSFGGNSAENNFTDLIGEMEQFNNGPVGNMRIGNQADVSAVSPDPVSPESESVAIRDQYLISLSNLEQAIKELSDGVNVTNQTMGGAYLQMDSQLGILQNPGSKSTDDSTFLLPYWRPFAPMDMVPLETPYIADFSIEDEDNEPKNYAVVVGINQYSGRRDLRASVNDAEKMAQILRELYGYEVILLTDKTENRPPTKHNILEGALAEIRAKQNRGEVLIYFSGHGEMDDDGNFYLLPRDADANSTSYISEDELNRYIKDINGLSLIVDACYSGGLYSTEGQRSYDDRRGIGVEQEQLILRSSREDEPSNEMWNETSSVFTYYLCQAIKDEAKKSGRLPLQLSLQSCFDSVKAKTVRWSSNHLLSQTPNLTPPQPKE